MLNCNKMISLLLAKNISFSILEASQPQKRAVCSSNSMFASRRERQKIHTVMLLKKINLLLVPVEQPFDGLKTWSNISLVHEFHNFRPYTYLRRRILQN